MTFPITPYLEQICTELKNSPTRFLILTAETAAGKSTVFPLSVLENFPGKIRKKSLHVGNGCANILRRVSHKRR